MKKRELTAMINESVKEALVKEGLNPAVELQHNLDALKALVNTLARQKGQVGMQMIAQINKSLSPFVGQVVDQVKKLPDQGQ